MADQASGDPAGAGRTAAEPIVPRDAATLVIVDRSSGELRVLLGKRRTSQAFAPGKYVFPGGSVDPGDLELATGELLAAGDRAALMHDIKERSGSVTPETFALAAIRETFEESGLMVGERRSELPRATSPGWERFLAHGLAPSIRALSFFARAITPPGRSRRFDARFFHVEASAVTFDSGSNDGEFEELVWCSAGEARARNLHGMTLTAIEELELRLALSPEAQMQAPVPYFVQSSGRWQRRLIPRQPAQ